MSSYFSSAPRPGRPTTSALYFARLEQPGSDNCVWMLEPAMLAVPVQRATDALAEAHLRGVADFRFRTRDVERAALREEVDAAAVEGRLDAQRYANAFAHGSRGPERPHGQMTRRGRHAGPPPPRAPGVRSVGSPPPQPGCGCGWRPPDARRRDESRRPDRQCR